MVKFYNWVGLSLLLILSCGNPINITGPKYSDVIVTEARFDDQLIVKGSRFKNIRAVAFRNPNTGQIIKRFKVMRYDDHTIIGEQLDYNKIPIPNLLDMLIDTAQGQSVIPVQFTISPNSVYTGAIQNGAITPTKFLGITTPDPQDQSVLTWSATSQQFYFSIPPGGGGGGSGDVTGIYYGTGIMGDGGTATGTVPIAVNIGTTGSPNPPEKVIPFFNNQNQIILDSTANPSTQLLFISGSEKISLSNEAGQFKIINETIALPAPERDLITIDAPNARVTIQNELYVGSQTVCLADGNGCPTGIQPITGVAPILVNGSIISADVGTNDKQLVQLEAAVGSATVGSLPAVDGIKLLNVVTKINALDGITVSNGGIGVVDIGLAPAGATGSAQPWSPALTDISNIIPYPPTLNGVIISDGSHYVLQSGIPLTQSIGLEIGVDVQAYNQNLEQISGATPTATGQFLLSTLPGQWGLANSPNCGLSGHLVAGDGFSFNCSDNNFVFKLKENQYYETSPPFTNYVGFVAPADVIVNTIWTLPAQDGAAGTVLTTDGAGKLQWLTGNGDVRGPASAAVGEVAVFSSTTGKNISNTRNLQVNDIVARSATPVGSGNLPAYNGTVGNSVQDSGVLAANVVTSSLGGLAQNLAMFTGGKDIQDSFISAGNVVTMPGLGGTGDYVLKSSIGVKTATESNILVANVPTMAANATGTYQPILSAGNNKTLISASYSIPLGVCPNGEILKSNGTNFICGTDTDTAPPVISVFGRLGAVVAVAGDYGADQVISTPTGFISANNVQAAINELDSEKLALAGGTMTGQLITSSQNAILIGKAAGPISGELKFEEATGNQYVGFKAPATIGANVIWTLPDVIGANGQVLTTVGGGVLQWTSVGTAGVGDVIGPGSSSDNAIARFNSTTGKIIKNSTVILDDSGNLTGVTSINGTTSTNFVSLIATPTGPNFVYLSNGADKVAKTTDYTLPPTKCPVGSILKADALQNFTCVPDTSGVISFNGRSNVVTPTTGDYTAVMVTNTPSGAIAASTTQGALNELDVEKLALAGGTMTGTLNTSIQNAIQLGSPGPNTGEIHFFEASGGPKYVGLKGPAVLAANYILTLPLDGGTNGQILSTTGAGVLAWTTPGGGGAGGVGDVVGPASAISTNLASFNGATGKLIQDSLISSNNVMTMTGPALAAGNILVSQGINKVAIDTTINVVGPGNNVTGLGTLNTRTIANWVDGPAGAISTNLAAFNGATGKLIADSGVATANVVTTDNNFSAANYLAISAGLNKKLIQTTYTVPQSGCPDGQVLKFSAGNLGCSPDLSGTGDVVGPASSTLNALARYGSGTGKLIINSPATLDDSGNLLGITSINGKTAGDFVTMATPASVTGQVLLSAGSGVTGKAAAATAYTFPTTTGTPGQVLKLTTAFDATWANGGGDVTGPGTSNLNELAVFADGTGKLIKAVPLIYLNIVTNTATPTTPNHVAIFDSATGKSIADSGKLITDLVTGPAGANPGNLASYNGAGGKLIQDSGISTTNVVTMIATPTGANYVYLSNGPDKTAKTSDFTIPSAVCPSGQVLKSNGTIYTCSLVGSGDVIGPATSVAGRPAVYLDASGKTLANTVPYTIPTITGTSGQVLTSDGVGATSWATITQGDVVGPGGSADNQAALFSGTTGKIIKAAPYTLPTGIGVAGQALTTNGAGVASWSPVGNVTQGTTSVAGNIPAYVDTTGKSLVDSNVLAVNIVTMPTPAITTGQVMLSAGAGKAAMVAPYTFPLTIVGTNGQVLTSNGVDAVWKPGGGDVTGPNSSADDQLAVFVGTTGKQIRNVPLTYLNIVTNTATPTVPNHVAIFDSTTGKSISDSGKLISDFVTGPAGTTMDYLASYTDAIGNKIKNSGILSTNVITNAAVATDNAIARFDTASGKLIQTSLVSIDDFGNLTGVGTINGNSAANIVTMIATPTAANYVYLSNGADKTAKTTTYTFPPGPCAQDFILKTDASGNFQCVAAAASGVISFNTRIGPVVPVANDYTAAMVTNTPAGAIQASSTQGALNELDTEKLALTGGVMTGNLTTTSVITTAVGGVQVGSPGGSTGEIHFMEANAGPRYVGFKSANDLTVDTIWTLPLTDGASGTFLSTDGAKNLSWTTITGGAGGIGDVVGPPLSTDKAIARFNSATGKLIQNSVVTIDDVGKMTGVTDFTSSGNFSVTGTGSFTGGLTAQSYTNTSDKSLKKDIEPFTGASSIIDKLFPVTFRWKNGDEKKVIGLIAQDMEKVIPEVVSKTNQKGNTIRSYDLGQVLILTLEALKETREELKQTKTELKVMREKVQDLEKRIP